MTDQARNDVLMRLLDAFERYYRTLSAEDLDGRRSFAEIAAWFESRDSSDPQGFERICKVLEFDPDSIRASLGRRSAEIRGGRVPVPPRKT